MTTKRGDHVHIPVNNIEKAPDTLINGQYDNIGFENDELDEVDNQYRKEVFAKRFRKPSLKEEPQKEISILYGAALIMNTIIGPGIFTSPKGVVKGAGSVGLTLIIWGGFGFFSAIAGLCFAELRESVTRDGVEYAYIAEAFGPHASFVYCWMRIAAAEPVATAIFCMAFSDYTMDYAYDNCGPTQLHRKVLGIFAVVTLAYLNVFSTKLSEKVQILGTLGKTIALAIIIICGIINLCKGEWNELKTGFDETETNPTSITLAIYNCLWAYGGWATVNNVTKGVKKPPRNLPRLIKVTLPTVGVIFMLVVTAYFTVMTREELVNSEAIGVTFGERALGKYGAIIPICVGFLALRSANSTFLDAGKLSGVAVKDHSMPEVTSFVHVRSKTPLLTVITRAMIAIVMIMLGTLSSLLNFFIFIVWAFHGFSILALIVLRFKNKEKVRPYKVYLFLPVIVVVGITAILITPFLERPKLEFILAVSFFILSIICYYPVKYLRSSELYQHTNMDKITIYLQLFLRIVPRNALKGKKKILEEKLYSRRMSTPETRGYIRYHSQDDSDLSTLNSLHSPVINNNIKPVSILKKGHIKPTKAASFDNSNDSSDSDECTTYYDEALSDDERSATTVISTNANLHESIHHL